MTEPVKLPTTAAECTKLAVIALDQAEKLVNGAAPDAGLVAAVARIGQGWAAVAMTLLEAERSVTVELTEFGPPQKLSGVTPLPESLARPGDHQHDGFCRHNWVRPMEPCANNCGQRPDHDGQTQYCPATCRVTDPPVLVAGGHQDPEHRHDFDTAEKRCTRCQITADALAHPDRCCPARCDMAARQMNYASADEFRDAADEFRDAL